MFVLVKFCDVAILVIKDVCQNIKNVALKMVEKRYDRLSPSRKVKDLQELINNNNKLVDVNKPKADTLLIDLICYQGSKSRAAASGSITSRAVVAPCEAAISLVGCIKAMT